MSIDDETFDIDLYGDEDCQDGAVISEDVSLEQGFHAQDERQDPIPNSNVAISPQLDGASATPVSIVGTKRKATDDITDGDERPLDHDAQASLQLSGLQWWTTEEDLRAFCARARVEAELVEVAFAEHKINGKSAGEAYLEFKTRQAASMVKREIEKSNDGQNTSNTIANKISVRYTSPGNPFRAREGVGKKEAQSGSRQGVYNSYHGSNSNNRGSYTGGRGRGGYTARGDGQWNAQHNANTTSFNTNMMTPGFAGFPAMGMNQAMMSAMMASGMLGGFMTPNMRGGGNMMGRGGWNNAPQQQGSYHNSLSKKPRME